MPARGAVATRAAGAEIRRGFAPSVAVSWGRLTELKILAPVLALLMLALLVMLPLLTMLVASLRPPGTLPFDHAAIIFTNFTSVFSAPDTAPMLRNTAIYAIVPIFIALPLAFGLAFLTERTDLPLRDAVYSAMFIPISIPVFASAMSWFLLLGPRAGTLNMWLRLIFGLDTREGPFNILSLEGMIFVHAIGIIPSMWLILISVLRVMDPALEEAASVSGANRLRSMIFVTVPLMAPGILAIIILFTVAGLESLETPLALGRPAGVEVMATRVYDLLHLSTGAGFAYGPPATIGLLGLVFGIIGISLYLYFTRRASKYVVITGKAYRPRLIRLGRWKYAALAAIAFYMTLQVVLPFGMLVVTSFQRFYQPLAPGSNIVWTANNYVSMLDYRFFGQYFLNTIGVSVGAATVTMLVVSFFSWQIVRWPSKLTQAVNFLAFMPLAIPGVISGLAFFLLFIGTPLYGTLILLVLAFLSRFLAYGTRLMHSAQVQIHKELEEAAVTAGVPYLKTFLWINLRLLLPAFFNGWLWVLTHAARDFTTPLMVASASSLLASNIIFGRYSDGKFSESAAMMVALVLFNVCAVVAGRKWIVRAVSGSQQ
jgi:iron(III) transport system permease protein